MRIYKEIPLTDLRSYSEIPLAEYNFWPEAQDRTRFLTEEELNRIEQILEQLYPEGLNEDEINSIFWLEEGLIAEWLGYESFAQIMERDE